MFLYQCQDTDPIYITENQNKLFRMFGLNITRCFGLNINPLKGISNL